MGVGAACAQDGPHDHSDDGEHSNRNNDHDHQDMILLAARDAWFIWHTQRERERYYTAGLSEFTVSVFKVSVFLFTHIGSNPVLRQGRVTGFDLQPYRQQDIRDIQLSHNASDINGML